VAEGAEITSDATRAVSLDEDIVQGASRTVEEPTVGRFAGTQEKGVVPKIGVIDESEAIFSDEEKEIARLLSSEGKDVKSLPRSVVRGQRTGDALVDGKRTEFKTMSQGGDDSTVKNEVSNSIKHGGQARDIVIDARSSGLSKDAAIKGLNRIHGISRGKLDSVRIIADDFDITRSY
jgi:hypothetical protein